MSDNFPKYGATLLNAVGLSRFEVTFDGDCIYSSDDASMDDGLLRYIAQLREQLAKAEAEAKRYREAWSDVRDSLIIDREFWNNKNANREVQISSTILRMDDLILSSEDHP